jgi:hypothetical protein
MPPPQKDVKKASGPATGKRTPADEGIAFFEGDISKGEKDIRVWELKLEPDGSAGKQGAVS